MKYELIEAEKNESGLKFRAKALRDFGNVKKGDISGLISNENCISQEGNCWVFFDAEMHDNAKIFDNAQMHDRAKMFDNSMMHDNSFMFDDTKMYHEAIMRHKAKMFGRSKMYNTTVMKHRAEMYDESEMYGNAIMLDFTKMRGRSTMFGYTKMRDYSEMHDDSEIHDNSEIHGYTVIGGTHKLEDEILRYPKLYKYISRPILDDSNKVSKIMMGCHTRTIDEWRRDFRNNTDEFPIGSNAEADRLNAINYILMTLGEDQIQLNKDEGDEG